MSHRLLPVAASLLALAAAPAFAGALSASSAAGGSSASSATSASSKSSETSSDSSSKGKAVAEGPYRIIDVAAVPERPGTLRMTLLAMADNQPGAANAAEPGAAAPAANELVLYVPQQAYESSRLAAGDTVTARHRPYGLEFANAGTRQPFFLVLSDEWYREIPSVPVVL